MYVIGRKPWDLIGIEFRTLYFSNKRQIKIEVDRIIYDIEDNNQCYITNSFEKAEKILNEIKTNTKNIRIENVSPVGAVLDREHGFKYDVNELKIYELVPTELETN